MSERYRCPHCGEINDHYTAEGNYEEQGSCRGTRDVEQNSYDVWDHQDSDQFEADDVIYSCPDCNEEIEWDFIENAMESEEEIYNQTSDNEERPTRHNTHNTTLYSEVMAIRMQETERSLRRIIEDTTENNEQTNESEGFLNVTERRTFLQRMEQTEKSIVFCDKCNTQIDLEEDEIFRGEDGPIAICYKCENIIKIK